MELLFVAINFYKVKIKKQLTNLVKYGIFIK